MRPQELETQICLLFSFYASLIEIQGCYLLLCLLPPQKSECEWFYTSVNTLCIRNYLFVKGSASFQYQLGCFSNHLLKKISFRHTSQNNSRRQHMLTPCQGNQTTLLAGQGLSKLLLLLFSHPWAREGGGRGYGITKGYSLLTRRCRVRRGCRKERWSEGAGVGK